MISHYLQANFKQWQLRREADSFTRKEQAKEAHDAQDARETHEALKRSGSAEPPHAHRPRPCVGPNMGS